MELILNEREYAERCLRENAIGESPLFTLSLIAKYDYAKIGYRKKRIERHLNDFIKVAYPQYKNNSHWWEEAIESIARSAGKYPLYENYGVDITKSEIRRINDAVVDGVPLEKKLKQLAFTYLCLAKLSNARNPKNDSWVNNKRTDIFTMAHITASAVRKAEMIGDLALAGLLGFPKNDANLSMRVLFTDDSDDIVMSVNDFRELGFEYLKYMGDNYTRCAECGRLFRRAQRSESVYCRKCVANQPKYGFKTILCVDCGKEIRVNMMNNSTTRCEDCYKVYRRECVKNNVQKYRLCNQSNL